MLVFRYFLIQLNKFSELDIERNRRAKMPKIVDLLNVKPANKKILYIEQQPSARKAQEDKPNNLYLWKTTPNRSRKKNIKDSQLSILSVFQFITLESYLLIKKELSYKNFGFLCLKIKYLKKRNFFSIPLSLQ
ncbi:hypothetical protein OVS_00580 [Mycoplasma ovis str. Michigan]|uniref:Transposase n=1 Tax=Mycoplasma ovis str. Michigan TaxID=1415773 RepID=A0ABM5P119_9MOLU|nr:hypothetical protein [Mycoplasma ovis]AHC40107.1 hypothetical protein OVS_00580 [Mycoplasma ovis str. Michigan]